ncbi:MAG: type VI secretion system baseplate subunit TssG [Desulfovibrionaceae bacterium]|nr:type VI secretion system baseplate subunit TssG [Desulfovibrionaceae bacterium]
MSAPAPSDPTNALRERLFTSPQDFSMVQVTRLLHIFYGAGMAYEHFLRERVSIRAHLSLAFPPRDVVSLEKLPGTQDGPEHFLLTVSPLGLYGASSPLPTFYVEDLLAESRADRSAGRDFLDIFNRVFYELFLRGGWFRYHPMRAVQEQQDQSFAEQLLALAGLGEAPLRQGMRDTLALAGFAGLLSQFPRSAAGLQAFLAGLFHLRCHICQCVPRKAPIPSDQLCRLGMNEHMLGENAVLGEVLDDASGKVGICLQDMTYEQFTTFADAEQGQQELLQWLDFYCTESLEADIHLSMKQGLARGVRLGAGPPPRGTAVNGEPWRWQCLGRDAWLGDGPAPTLWKEDEGDYPEGTGMAIFRKHDSLLR